MLGLKQTQNQKNILKTAFAIVFIVSFALVVFERIKIGNQFTELDAQPLVKAIRGSAVRASSIDDYRNIVSHSLVVLNQSIDFLLAGNKIYLFEVENVYQELLNTSPPPLYKSLHFSLVKLARETNKKEKADIDLIRESRRMMYESYPWLVIVAQP